jgi:hypothetical protein
MRALRPRSQSLLDLVAAARGNGPIFCESCHTDAMREFRTRDFRPVRLPLLWLCSACQRLAPGRFRGSIMALEVQALIAAALDDLIDAMWRCGADFARPDVRYYFLGVTEAAGGEPAIEVELVKGPRTRRLCLPLGAAVPRRWPEHAQLVGAGYWIFARRCLFRRTVFSVIDPFWLREMPSAPRDALGRAFQAAPPGRSIEALVYDVLSAPRHYAAIEREMSREALDGVRALLEELAPPGASPLPPRPPLPAATTVAVVANRDGDAGVTVGEGSAVLERCPLSEGEDPDAADPTDLWAHWCFSSEEDS